MCAWAGNGTKHKARSQEPAQQKAGMGRKGNGTTEHVVGRYRLMGEKGPCVMAEELVGWLHTCKMGQKVVQGQWGILSRYRTQGRQRHWVGMVPQGKASNSTKGTQACQWVGGCMGTGWATTAQWETAVRRMLWGKAKLGWGPGNENPIRGNRAHSVQVLQWGKGKVL